MKKRRLIFDTANCLFRVSAAQGKYGQSGTAEDRAGLALHVSLNVFKSFYNKYRPDEMALTFEGQNNWRKAYTKSEECVSKRIYKGQRVADDSMQAFFELIASFQHLIRNHTSLVCLQNPLVEGDDLFGGYVDYYSAQGDEVFGVSGDKDFVQLIGNENFTLLNPDKLGANRHLDKDGKKIDADYFMFEKAIRGDGGDNVMSAYPRVRSTRILKAYTDEYERTNFMNETWEFVEPSTGEKRIFRVGDLFEENQLLMNLRRQPDYIKEEIRKTIEHETIHHGQFNFFEWNKFLGKNKLKKIAEDSATFVEMFSATGKSSIHKEETKAIHAAMNAEKKEKRKNSLTF